MPELLVSRDVLKSALDQTFAGVSKSGARAELECFHVAVSESMTRVTTSDLNNTLSTSFYEGSDTPFTALIPAARFLAVVRQSSPGIIQISLKDSVVSVLSGNTSWDIKVPAVPFPKLPKIPEPSVSVDVKVLRDAISSTKKSMADSPMRPTLRMLNINRGKMTACDGVKFSQVSLGENFPLDFSMDIPYGAVDVLTSLLKSASGKVYLDSLENQHVFQVGTVALLSQKLTSSFPDVEKLMLRSALENTHELILDTQGLAKAINRVRINADPETDAIGLSLGSRSATVTSRDSSGNGGSEVLESNWTGKDRMLVVNHKYLSGMVSSVSSDECHFFLGDDTKSRKSVLLLKDEESGFYGIIPQFSGNVRVF